MSEMAANLIKRAMIARRERRLGDSHDLYRKAVVTARSAGTPEDLIIALKGVAQLERDLGHNEVALAHYEEATSLCRVHASRLELAHTVRHVGDAQRGAGRLAEAASCYAEALALYRAEGATQPLELANTLRGLALVHEARGEGEEAAHLWREARELYSRAGVAAGVAESERRLVAL